MVSRPTRAPSEIYADFVRMRLSGLSLESVVRELRGEVDRLPARDRDQLNDMVTKWEEKAQATAQQPKIKIAPIAPPVQPQHSVAPKPSVVRPIAPAAGDNKGQAPGQQFCPRCGKPNRLNDSYCYACGQLLQTARKGAATRGLDVLDSIDIRSQPDYFGPGSNLVLMVFGVPKTVRLNPDGETVIGRSSTESPVMPDIDLAQFDAESLGVSRLHASLKRDEHTIHITDLNSKNFTFINGQRLYPREIRVLRDGDEVRLGKLNFRVIFQHQA